MSTEPNNTQPQPPAPDPFEALAATLAQCAAMLVQCAGQITQLKNAQQQPQPQPQPPAPAPEPTPEPTPEPEPEEPKPEEQPEEQPEQSEGEASEQEQASDEQPTHEDGRAGEKEGEPSSEADTDSEQSEADEQPQPDADELTESEQDREGQELDEQPPAEAEPQPADSAEGEGEQQEQEQEQEQSEDAPSAPADAQASEGEADTDEGEASEDAQSSPQQAAAQDEQDEQEQDAQEQEQDEQDEQDTDEASEPMPTFDEGEHSAHGDGDQDAEKPKGEADNDSKGTAAMLPPDLPPIDPSLAKCSPPPPPSATPYRPLTPVAKKVADILTNALGKSFAIPRPDRHTGTLNSAAIARHATDVFKRRPRQDGRRPSLTVIVDTSGSMALVRKLYGLDLIDGLLEAHRRKVINLRLYDSAAVKSGYANFPCDATGLFQEDAIKKALKPSLAFGKTPTADQLKITKAENAVRMGALPANGGCEGFAESLQKLLPVIKSSDATIVFTDGHWTDGSLDKVHYQQNGIQVVGLYIDPASNLQRDLLAALDALIESAAPDKREKLREQATDLKHKLSLLAALQRDSFSKRQALELEQFKATQRGERLNPDIQRNMVDACEAAETKSSQTCEAVIKLESTLFDAALNAGARDARSAFKDADNAASRCGMHNITDMIYSSAASAAQLAYNSHRSYAMPDAITAAQAIVQEIAMQLAAQ